MLEREILVATALAMTLAGSALAQQPAPAPSPKMPTRTTTMPGMAGQVGGASPSTTAFKAADDKMMRDMGRPMTGDADRDFVSGMLPHHGGAIDMARVELEHGRDPEMLKLARGIIAAQEKEMALMRAWQQRHPNP